MTSDELRSIFLLDVSVFNLDIDDFRTIHLLEFDYFFSKVDVLEFHGFKFFVIAGS